MTRWVKGIYEALKPLETLPIEGLVRVWAHEALRLFQDRLIYDEERMWTDENIDMVAMKHFPNVDKQVQWNGIENPIRGEPLEHIGMYFRVVCVMGEGKWLSTTATHF